MPVVIAPKLMDIAQADDPYQALIDNIGDISKVKIYGENALVANYIAPEKTKGGIYRTKETMAEYEWQGKVGLVLKLGTHCDGDDEKEFFHQWVVFHPNDGLRQHLNGVACRFIGTDRIRARVPDPSMVY